jgi:hypothetical protein
MLWEMSLRRARLEVRPHLQETHPFRRARKSYLSTEPRRGVFLNEEKRTEEQVDSILEAAKDEQGEG